MLLVITYLIRKLARNEQAVYNCMQLGVCLSVRLICLMDTGTLQPLVTVLDANYNFFCLLTFHHVAVIRPICRTESISSAF